MEQKLDLAVLRANMLFRNLTDEEVLSVIDTMLPHTMKYEKRTVVARDGDGFSEIGVILSGSVHLFHIDSNGNSNLMDVLGAGDTLGELSAVGRYRLHVTVTATAQTEILFLSVDRLLRKNVLTAPTQIRFLQNLTLAVAKKGQYLTRKPKRSDVLSVFAGLRPLAAPSHSDCKKTKEISRNHKIYVSDSGMLTITGGKWTTYRQMAEEAVNRVAELIGLERRPCVTRKMKLHGYREQVDRSTWDYVYGSDADEIAAMIENDASLGDLLHIGYTFRVAHVVWAVREEMAQTVEDVLARRVRALFMDARAAIDMAPRVASIMAREMGKDRKWEADQVEAFTRLAKNYILA